MGDRRFFFGSLTVLFLLAACDSSTEPGHVRPVACDADQGLELEVGSAVEFEESRAELLCVRVPPSSEGLGQDFLLVAHAGTPSSRDRVSLSARAENTRGALGPPAPSPPGPEAAAAGVLAPARLDPLDAHRFHIQLRERERRELAPRTRPGDLHRTLPAAASPASPPEVGSLVSLNTQAGSACSDPRYVTARVEAVSEQAIVLADTANPAGGFDTGYYEEIARFYDEVVAPLSDRNFGEPTDLDGTGRVTILYTREVNRLSEADSEGVVGGFFFARDLFPRERTDRLDACEHSNVREMFYLLVPDPGGEINHNVRTRDFVDRITRTTIAHEAQHLVSAARRLHILRVDAWFEELWLNEALSHMAEELLFYRVSGLSPGRNIDMDLIRDGGDRTLDALNAHQIGNAIRFREYLRAPEENSPYNQEEGASLPTRGASWHFLRFLADRYEGSEEELFYELVNNHRRGIDNLRTAVGGSSVFHQRLADWGVAIYADGRVPNLEARHRDQSWDHGSLFAALGNPPGPFPLRTHALGDATVVEEEILGGSAAYFRFNVRDGETGLIELSAQNGGPLPDGFRATLLRTR